jgi:putative ABC transport system ATP-binding protein
VPPPLFSFDHVSVAAPQGWRLRDACGEIGEGATAIVGPSGSGKSTLLRLCNRLVVPAEGVVRFRGDDVAALDPLRLRRRVGMVFQRPTPFAGTCFENLRVAQPEIDARAAAELLDRVRLDASFLERDALALSGGEAQRLCLARSLAARPEVLLMDEVTSSVDGETRTALEGLARDCVADGIPVLWVTHDVAQARRVADEIVVVLEGRIADAERAGAYLEERSNAE